LDTHFGSMNRTERQSDSVTTSYQVQKITGHHICELVGRGCLYC